MPIDVGDMVRVVNHESHDLKWAWDSRPYRIPANNQGFVPFELAVKELGDPRSAGKMASFTTNRGLTGFIPDRASEVRRLRAIYGNGMVGSEDEILDFPEVEVYDLDGNLVTMVVHDPLGETTTPAVQTVHDQSQLFAIIEKQQKQLAALMEMVQGDIRVPPTIGETPAAEGEDGGDNSDLNTDGPTGDEEVISNENGDLPPEDDGLPVG